MIVRSNGESHDLSSGSRLHDLGRSQKGKACSYHILMFCSRFGQTLDHLIANLVRGLGRAELLGPF